MRSFVIVSLPALAAAEALCKTCKGPVWSWEQFPAFFHSADQTGPDGGFTDAALETIARFPMATLEKWQGELVKPQVLEEEAWVVAAKQIKSKSPNTTVVVWFDSLRIYTKDLALNPDLKEPCTTGNFGASTFLETHQEYLLKNTSDLPALESWSHCHILDFTKKFAQDFWTSMCLNVTASGVVDGCGADASWQTGVDQDWGLDAATAAAWRDGHKAMMRTTTAALGDGVLLGKNAYEINDYVNGALHEGCAANNETIETLRNLTRISEEQGKRLVYQCHGKGYLDEIAAFLIGVGPYQYYGLGDWKGTGEHGNFSEHWIPGVFDQKLGEPQGPGVYNAQTNEWTRSFASGTRVVFNADSKKGSITWGEESALLV